jgi:stearoyl-CoA desaturase (delta-9 desaturase)
MYRRESRVQETRDRFGRGTPDDWLERNLYQKHSLMGPTVLMFLELMIFGWPALIMWVVQMIWIPLWASGFVNGVGHWWGYRNFASPDSSTNIFPWGVIAGGEELHNNHHAFGTSAKLSVKWWEFDIGWTYIRLFEMLGLAKVHRSIPKIISDPKKNEVDSETLGALLGNRFQVLDQYWRKVVRPVLREQKQQASKPEQGLLRGARRLLTKDEAQINAAEQEQLQKILATGPSLKKIYDLRKELQEVWHRTTVRSRCWKDCKSGAKRLRRPVFWRYRILSVC